MKSYFEKYFKPKVVTQPDKPKQTIIDPFHSNIDSSAQFNWVKPNKAPSFVKSIHVGKFFTQRKLKNHLKPKEQLNLKPDDLITEVNQLDKQQQMQQSDDQVNSHNTRERGFSLEYLKMTKKHKVKSLLQKNILRNPANTQSKAWLDSPFDRIQLPFSQNRNDRAHSSTRKVLTPLSGGLSKQKDTQAYRTQYSKSKSGDHLNLLKSKSKKVNHFFKKFAIAQEILSSNPPRSPSQQQRTTSISFIPIDSIRLQNTRYGGFNQTKTHKTQRQISNKSFVKKSRYSPFKSRNGSSSSNNEQLKLVKIDTKGFSVQDQQPCSISSIKQSKNFRLNKHKRLKSQVNSLTHLSQSKKDMPSKQINQTIAILNNSNSSKIITQGLYGSVKLLNEIKDCFEVQIPSLKQQKIHLTKISQLIKIYVFGQKDVTQKKYMNHLFPHMDQLFEKEEDKLVMKQTICAQRLLMICIVDLIGQEKLISLFEEVKLTLMVLLLIYLKIFKLSQASNIKLNFTYEQEQYISALLNNKKLRSKNLIQMHLKAQLLPYVDNLFRHSRQMYENVMKQQIEASKTRTINRTFYQILKNYAIYLTTNEQTTLKKYNNPLICNFATCPAPYILSKPQKRYTLCIDLDQTLLFSNFSCSKRFETSYRPGSKQFIIQLSKYFQIIVFTSSVKEYADAVIKPFVQFVDHALYRYHVTRTMNLSSTVKDLSRIGRRLENVIFVDDLECNTKLQPENSIRVTPWKGDPNDKQIITLKNLLLSLGREEEEHEDLRKVIGNIREKLIIQKKSPSKSPELK